MSDKYTAALGAASGKPEWIQKADTTTALILEPNGELVPAQADRFIRLLQKEATILPIANVQKLAAKKQQLPKVRFGSRVLRAGQEATALPVADRATPDFSGIEYDTKLFKAEVSISREVIEDNIEGDTFIQTLLEILGVAAGTDLEEVVVNGNTASLDPFLAQFDGMITAATTNIHDALGATFDQNTADALIKTLPVEFRKNGAAQRFFTDWNSEQGGRNTQGTRATQLGDDQLINQDMVKWFGRVVYASDVWPSDLGAGSNETVVILTSAKNVGVGIWKGIEIWRENDNRANTTSWVVRLRADFKYIHEPAAAKAIQVTSS